MCVSVSVFAMYTFDFTQNLSSLDYTRRIPLCMVVLIENFYAFLYFFVDVRQRKSWDGRRSFTHSDIYLFNFIFDFFPFVYCYFFF